METHLPQYSPLGKTATYLSQYQADLLFPIPRKMQRDAIYVPEKLPFAGHDIWNAYELSWLNPNGKPIVAVGEFIFPCTSPNLIESKSFKLYLNSFNNTHFDSVKKVIATLEQDLSKSAGAPVQVKVIPLNEYPAQKIEKLTGICLDLLDVACDTYQVKSDFLTTERTTAKEIIYSDLLKSNCLVTGQPDWASVQIDYTGQKINHEGLLKYLVSFRDHNEFHEQCVERIFMDILKQCQPEKLTVYARYTRRGGLDINPIRSTEKNITVDNIRLERQ